MLRPRVSIFAPRHLRLSNASLAFAAYPEASVDLSLSFMGDPLELDPGSNAFGSGLRSLRLEQVKVQRFSSDLFRGLHDQAHVEIKNCTLVSERRHPWHSHDPDASAVKLRSLSLSDLVLSGPGHSFLDLRLSSSLAVRRAQINLYGTESIKVVVEGKAEFVDSSLRLLSARALDLKGREIVFNRVHFLEPKQQSLSAVGGLPGMESNSSVSFGDVILRDPSKGIMLVEDSFGKIDFRNVSVVDVCHCKQVRYLVSDVGELGFRIRLENGEEVGATHMEKLRRALENETYCLLPSGESVRPSEAAECQTVGNSTSSSSSAAASTSTLGGGGGLDGATAAILALLCLGILAVVAFSGAFLYRWHTLLHRRVRLLRGMKLHATPATEQRTDDHKASFVRFSNLVKVFPRPPSIFYIASEAPAVSAADDEHHQQPDLVRSVSQRSAASRPATVFRRLGSSEDRPDFDSIIELEEAESEEVTPMGDLAELEALGRRATELARSIEEEEGNCEGGPGGGGGDVRLRSAADGRVARCVSIPLGGQDDNDGE